MKKFKLVYFSAILFLINCKNTDASFVKNESTIKSVFVATHKVATFEETPSKEDKFRANKTDKKMHKSNIIKANFKKAK